MLKAERIVSEMFPFYTPGDSQQPVDGDQEADVLRGQAHRREDQKHGHESGAGDTGSSDTCQGGCHTEQEKQVQLSAGENRMLQTHTHTHAAHF